MSTWHLLLTTEQERLLSVGSKRLFLSSLTRLVILFVLAASLFSSVSASTTYDFSRFGGTVGGTFRRPSQRVAWRRNGRRDLSRNSNVSVTKTPASGPFVRFPLPVGLPPSTLRIFTKG